MLVSPVKYLLCCMVIFGLLACPLNRNCLIGEPAALRKDLLGHWENYGEDGDITSVFISPYDSLNYTISTFSYDSDSSKNLWKHYFGCFSTFDGDTILNLSTSPIGYKWSREEIDTLRQYGLVKGSDSTFNPSMYYATFSFDKEKKLYFSVLSDDVAPQDSTDTTCAQFIARVSSFRQQYPDWLYERGGDFKELELDSSRDILHLYPYRTDIVAFDTAIMKYYNNQAAIRTDFVNSAVDSLAGLTKFSLPDSRDELFLYTRDFTVPGFINAQMLFHNGQLAAMHESMFTIAGAKWVTRKTEFGSETGPEYFYKHTENLYEFQNAKILGVSRSTQPLKSFKQFTKTKKFIPVVVSRSDVLKRVAYYTSLKNSQN